MTDLAPTLLPCPFCRGEARADRAKNTPLAPWVTCTNKKCGADVCAHSLEEAVSRWNTRPDNARLVEALRKIAGGFASEEITRDDARFSERLQFIARAALAATEEGK